MESKKNEVAFRAHVSSELAAELARIIPFTLPTPSQSEREVMYAAGQQSVVRLLLELSEVNYGKEHAGLHAGGCTGGDTGASEGELAATI